MLSRVRYYSTSQRSEGWDSCLWNMLVIIHFAFISFYNAFSKFESLLNKPYLYQFYPLFHKVQFGRCCYSWYVSIVYQMIWVQLDIFAEVDCSTTSKISSIIPSKNLRDFGFLWYFKQTYLHHFQVIVENHFGISSM